MIKLEFHILKIIKYKVLIIFSNTVEVIIILINLKLKIINLLLNEYNYLKIIYSY